MNYWRMRKVPKNVPILFDIRDKAYQDFSILGEIERFEGLDPFLFPWFVNFAHINTLAFNEHGYIGQSHSNVADMFNHFAAMSMMLRPAFPIRFSVIKSCTIVPLNELPLYISWEWRSPLFDERLRGT
jgi:hypothetical protein